MRDKYQVRDYQTDKFLGYYYGGKKKKLEVGGVISLRKIKYKIKELSLGQRILDEIYVEKA